MLRAARPAQIVNVDEGWRPDRDLSLAIGRWGWLHVRTLVEDHEHGACVFRVQARLRPSVVGTLSGGTLAVVVVGGASASVFIYNLPVTLMVSAVAIAGIGARAAWQALRSAAVLDRARMRVTRAAGLLRLPLSTEDQAEIDARAEIVVEAEAEVKTEADGKTEAKTEAELTPAARLERLRVPQ